VSYFLIWEVDEAAEMVDRQLLGVSQANTAAAASPS
jgi:hypothetical protein